MRTRFVQLRRFNVTIDVKNWFMDFSQSVSQSVSLSFSLCTTHQVLYNDLKIWIYNIK